MRYSLGERIVGAITIGVTTFILLCLLHGIADKPYWFSHSVIWSGAWAIGYFVSKTFSNCKCSIRERIGNEVAVILILLMLMNLVLVMICNIQNYAEIIYRVLFPFGFSLILNNDWQRG